MQENIYTGQNSFITPVMRAECQNTSLPHSSPDGCLALQSLVTKQLIYIRECLYELLISIWFESVYIIMKFAVVFSLLFSFAYSTKLSLTDTSQDSSTQVNVTESERANKETVSIDVQRVDVDRDANGGFEDARILKVLFSHLIRSPRYVAKML